MQLACQVEETDFSKGLAYHALKYGAPLSLGSGAVGS